MRAASRPLASISVDLDGFAAMYRTRKWGVPDEVRDLNAVYSDALPRFLALFAEEGIRATFFVVGEDALPHANRALLRQAVSEGHELANHSMTHPHLPTLEPADAEREVVEAEEALRAVTGTMPRGFRSPAWMPTEPLLELLARRGYRYDASVFPTPWLALWRALRARQFPPRLREAADAAWIWSPRAPTRLSRGGRTLWEIPAATTPVVRLPIWGTLLHWLGPEPFRILSALASAGAPVSMVLHGWELVDFALIGDRRFFEKPGFDRPFRARERLLRDSLRWMRDRWELLPLEHLVDRLEASAPPAVEARASRAMP